MAGVSAGELFSALDTGKYSDFIINCQGVEFKVHRVVVCSASPMIRAALDRPFKVGCTSVLLYYRSSMGDRRP